MDTLLNRLRIFKVIIDTTTDVSTVPTYDIMEWLVSLVTYNYVRQKAVLTVMALSLVA